MFMCKCLNLPHICFVNIKPTQEIYAALVLLTFQVREQNSFLFLNINDPGKGICFSVSIFISQGNQTLSNFLEMLYSL